jgi:hypothetical protein
MRRTGVPTADMLVGFALGLGLAPATVRRGDDY